MKITCRKRRGVWVVSVYGSSGKVIHQYRAQHWERALQIVRQLLRSSL